MIRILLADDHELFREPLKRLIEAQDGMVVVGEAARTAEVLSEARRGNPDVVLLDIEMPGRSCVEVVADLKGWRRDLRILVVTGYHDKAYAVRLLREGADGYITKDAAPQTLLDAIKRVFHGNKYITPDLAEELARVLTRGSDEAPHQRLSAREYEVMLHLAKARTVSEIADELALSVKTVSTYRTRIIEKLGLRNNAEIMRYALQQGLIRFPEEPGKHGPDEPGNHGPDEPGKLGPDEAT
jgi:DNA-binding NarL/FixJ family response regulator